VCAISRTAIWSSARENCGALPVDVLSMGLSRTSMISIFP
jgi:hypothetical protein